MDSNCLILDGYDAVAFFTEDIPEQGNAGCKFNFMDTDYYYVSHEHLELLEA